MSPPPPPDDLEAFEASINVQADPLRPVLVLRSIVHVSSAVTPMSEAALETLLIQSRRDHADSGTTGLMIYSDGCFMQCIEGDALGVAAARERIRTNGLHRDLFELLDEAIPRRHFTDWQIATPRPTRSTVLTQSTAAWRLRMSQDGSKEPDCLALLRQFWMNAR